MMIDLVYDYQILVMQRYGGISRYFYEIINRIKGDEDFNINIPILYSDNYYFGNEFNKIKNLRKGKFFFNKLNMKLYEEFHKKQIDILHPTYYNLDYLTKHDIENRNYKIVITVHDMIHELLMPKEYRTIADKKRIIKAADGIITVSEYTKNDLIKFFPELDTNKIRVIYHGCSMGEYISKKDDMKLPEQYILFVGGRTNYKNFRILLEAFPIVMDSYPKIKIICAGGGVFSESEKQIMNKLGIEGKVIQYSMTDSQLSYAYRNANCFVFPSKYEGFGIPILEAFYCDCPVILSNCSCFPEIAGEAALYFESDNVSELADCIITLLKNDFLAKQLIQKGRERLTHFSWDKAAIETKRFYKEVLNMS